MSFALLIALAALVFGSHPIAVTTAQAANAAVKRTSSPPMTNPEAQSDLRGPMSRAELERYGFPWMNQGVPAGRVKNSKDSASVKTVAASLPGTDLEIYFGSWCSDSHDHLPTFLALLDAAKEFGASPKSLKLVALDRKKTYDGYVNSRAIEKLPTFVFLRDGQEIGRIIETPEVSIAADSARILKK